MKTLYFFINDFKNTARSPFLLYAIFVPVILAFFIRFVFPPVALFIIPIFPLESYFLLVLSVFFTMVIPVGIGAAVGFSLLQEKENKMFLVISATSFSSCHYLLYKIVFSLLLSVSCILITAPITGMLSIPLVSFLPVVVISSMIAPVFVATVLVFSNNTIEGIGIMRALALVLCAPLLVFFLKSHWHLVMGILPTYWTFMAFLRLAQSSPQYWLYVYASVLINMTVLVVLTYYFEKKGHA